MTPKQKKFAELYASSGNATTAAAGAGYSPKTAYSQGQRMLKNVEINKYLQSITADEQRERVADALEIQSYWTGVMRDTEEKTADRLRASELLSKVQGGIVPDNQVNVNVSVDNGNEDNNDMTYIFIPWSGRGEYNAIKRGDEIVKFADIDPDEDMIIYYDPAYPEGMGGIREWDEPDVE